MKKVAVLQSNYIPWKGYFDLIAFVDEFVVYDDVQYTRRDWRNRNKIKTPNGLQWLTIPVDVKGKYFQRIRDTHIKGDEWAEVHLKSLSQNYKQAKYFDEVYSVIEPLYRFPAHNSLSALNKKFIEAICGYLGIATKISNSWDYELAEGKNERILGICEQADATVYVSGPAAKDYLDESQFLAKGIEVSWFEYDGYSEYPQLWGGFEHGVTILDLLFNCGPQAYASMKYV